MALLLNPNQIPQDLIAQHDRFSPFSKRCIQFEIQVALIPDQNKFEYRSPQDLIRRVIEFEKSEPGGGHLYFHGIPDSKHEVIPEKVRKSQKRSIVCFTYENALHAAILHLHPGGIVYGYLTSNIATQLLSKMDSIPGYIAKSVIHCGAILFEVPGVRSKQGDRCLVSDERRRRQREWWPSVMIQVAVGNAIAMDFLRLDAEWWLMNSDKNTRFVILVKLETDPFALHIECWMMVETGRRQTRLTPALIPRCVQDFDINEAGDVTSIMGSTELEVPYGCIFDEVPNPSPPATTLSIAELSAFALWLFETLGGLVFCTLILFPASILTRHYQMLD